MKDYKLPETLPSTWISGVNERFDIHKILIDRQTALYEELLKFLKLREKWIPATKASMTFEAAE